MPSKSVNIKARTKQQKDGSSQAKQQQNNQHSSSILTTKLSFMVLLISFALFYAYYDQQQRPQEHRLFGGGGGGDSQDKWDQVIEAIHQTIQQWTRPLWTRLRTLFGGSIRADSVLNGLLRKEKSVNIRADSAIAIGFGACTDLIVRSSIEIFDKFASPANPQPHAQILEIQDLFEVFAYYFKHGAASERYIKSKSVFEQLLQLIKKSPHIWHESIGGNAPLMTQRFSKEGIRRILLGAQVSPQFANQLPGHVQISGPIIEKDDYHILLEYKTGQKWGPFKSPRSNRLIVHSDDNNARILSLKNFFQQASQFAPDLLIISGLQMLDNSPISIGTRAQAIEQLSSDVAHLRASMEQNEQKRDRFKVHFELASYTENKLLGAIVDNIFPHVDSFGMNEQEVANLLSFLKFGNISFVSSPFPRIAHVLDEVRELYSLLALIGEGRVSRIHVHTLAYQVIAVRLDGSKSVKWPNSAAAAAKSSLTAYRHTCGSEKVDLRTARILLDESFTTSIRSDKYKQRIYFDSDDPTACWTEELPNENPRAKSATNKVRFCLAVGMVCTNVLQTGGGGDNVSAGGLVLQI